MSSVNLSNMLKYSRTVHIPFTAGGFTECSMKNVLFEMTGDPPEQALGAVTTLTKTCFASKLCNTLNKPANNPLMSFMIRLSFCGFMRLG